MFRRWASKIAVPLALAVALGASTLPRAGAQTPAPKAKAKAKAKAETSEVKTPLDLNKATAEEMIEVLPGVGEATAKKIIAGRPYTSVDDLAKAGVPARTIATIRALVVVEAVPKAKAEAAPKKAMTKAAPTASKIDLNKATAEEMVDVLPGVGEATAKKIIAGRPYASIDDLAKAGVPARTITALRDHATVSAPTPAPTAVTAPASAKPAAKTTGKSKTAPRAVPGKPVNINTATREELDALPGIGEVKSQAIIDARPFKTKEDIMKVKGIKEGEFSRIKNLITVD